MRIGILVASKDFKLLFSIYYHSNNMEYNAVNLYNKLNYMTNQENIWKKINISSSLAVKLCLVKNILFSVGLFSCVKTRECKRICSPKLLIDISWIVLLIVKLLNILQYFATKLEVLCWWQQVQMNPPCPVQHLNPNCGKLLLESSK